MKYKILKVSPYIFIDMCKYGFDKIRIVKDSLPDDAKFIRAHVDDVTGWGNISLVIESESFDELKDGDLIPIIPYPTFEKVHLEDANTK